MAKPETGKSVGSQPAKGLGSGLGKGLGKGLGALINTRVATPAPIVEEGERVQQIPLDRIVASPLQPRTEFREEELRELVDSIRERGVIQPLIVRLVAGKYELIAGERRLRASLQVGLTEAPVIVRKASDQEVLELALIENLQREGLNPIEEATAYSRLSKEFRLTQEEICRRVGKSRPAVANAMRLLELAPEVQNYLTQGRLSTGHAKVLLALKGHDEQTLLAEKLIRSSASVRDAEQLVAAHLAGSGQTRKRGGRSKATKETPAHIKHLENRLRQRFNTGITLHHGDKKGHISIDYYGNDDLHRLLGELGVPVD